ncbi:hypothetical protein BK138_28345 [Paenibacillus rhizosphaerae]|uniref:Uncharacterized protein n=1 Tax=Paenibacillus rhizosphaerae TaxID=297318 RepID=A0A1R1EEH1_9BACL|nr:hypothetical protein [Paenibacillus rhizosphaerae]OMF50197.1 hypothetical protein BK138_28345 [Paenibacillus rhizosphaerae]
MFNLFFLGTMLWLALCITVVARLRRRERRIIQEQILHIGQLANETNGLVLFLDYTSPDFKEIDALLISEMPNRATIVFQAPEWLVAAKRKKWGRHCVLDASSLNAQLSGWNTTRVVVDKSGSYNIFYEVPAYIKLMIQQKTGRIGLLRSARQQSEEQ